MESKPRSSLLRDQYSIFNVVMRTPVNCIRDGTNNILDTIDKFLSNSQLGKLHIDAGIHTPYSTHKWAKFVHIQTPRVNNVNDVTHGLLLGLWPSIFGRHRKA